ncbi:MAG: acyl-CoA dehydrogenase [Candidatus Eisenbacteria bacterium]
MGDLILEDAAVPASARLGAEGQGLAVFSAAMEWERACIFAANLGAMQRVLDRCVEHARVRKQFGQSIGKFSAVADRLVRAQTEIELARLLLQRLGWKKGRGQDATTDAAMAKLFISEAHVQLTLDAIQIFGGYGYCTEYEIEREHRDAVASRIYSGTSEIQRKILAHALGL